MSFRSWIIDQLINHGMFANDAEIVFGLIENADCNVAMCGRWNDPIGDYPKGMLAIAWLTSKKIALKWIDENCPQVWFRPMFAE